MKNSIYFLFVFLVASCSTKLNIIDSKNTELTAYKKVLFVTNRYLTNKNYLEVYFNTHLKNYSTISKVNTKIINLIEEELMTQQKYVSHYFIKHDLNNNVDLTEEEIQQKIDGEVLDKNIDLVVYIQQKDITRVYNKLKARDAVFKKDTYNASTNSTNLKYTYVLTAKDIYKDTIVFKTEFLVNNADNFFTKVPKQVAEKVLNSLHQKQLY